MLIQGKQWDEAGEGHWEDSEIRRFLGVVWHIWEEELLKL